MAVSDWQNRDELMKAQARGVGVPKRRPDYAAVAFCLCAGVLCRGRIASAQMEKWVVGPRGAKLYYQKNKRPTTKMYPYTKGWRGAHVSVPGKTVLETKEVWLGQYLYVAGAPEKAGDWVKDLSKKYFFVKKDEVDCAPDAFEAGAALEVSGTFVFGTEVERHLSVKFPQGVRVKAVGFEDLSGGLCLVSATIQGRKVHEYWVAKTSLTRRGALMTRTYDDSPGGKKPSGGKWYKLGLGGSEKKAVKHIQEAEGYRERLGRGACPQGDSYLSNAGKFRREADYELAEKSAEAATNEYLMALAKAKIDEARRLSRDVPFMKTAQGLIRRANECIQGYDGRGAYNRADNAVKIYNDRGKEKRAKAAIGDAEIWQARLGKGKHLRGDSYLSQAKSYLDDEKYDDASKRAERACEEYKRRWDRLAREAKSTIADAERLQRQIVNGRGSVPKGDTALKQARASNVNSSFANAAQQGTEALEHYKAYDKRIREEREGFEDALTSVDSWERFIRAHQWLEAPKAKDVEALRKEVNASYNTALIRKKQQHVQGWEESYVKHAQGQIEEARKKLGSMQGTASRLASLCAIGKEVGVELRPSVASVELARIGAPPGVEPRVLYSKWKAQRKADSAFDFAMIEDLKRRLALSLTDHQRRLLGWASSYKTSAEQGLGLADRTREGIFSEGGPHADSIERTREGWVEWAKQDFEKGAKLLDQLVADTTFDQWKATTFKEACKSFQWAQDGAKRIIENTNSGPNVSEDGATEIRLRPGDFVHVSGSVTRNGRDRIDHWLIVPATDGASPLRVRLAPAGSSRELATYYRSKHDEQWQPLSKGWTDVGREGKLQFDGNGDYEFQAIAAGGSDKRAIKVDESWDDRARLARSPGPPF